MIREAIERIEELTKPLIHTIGDDQFAVYSDGPYMEIRPELDIVQQITLYSLDALVQMVKTEAIRLHIYPIYIEVHSHDAISCFTKTDAEIRNQRQYLYDVRSKDVPGWKESDEFPFEEALIALRTRFQKSDNTEYLLRLLSTITNGAKVTYTDNGIATTVVTQRGTALQGSEAIVPIVSLMPYRTFQEIDQPESPFHIRISEGGIRFIEADGGMWKLDARRKAAQYLTERLSQEVKDNSVIIML